MCETKSVTSSMYLDVNEGYPDVSNEEKRLKTLESQYKKGLLSDTTFETECKALSEIIPTGHNYRFVGKVGQFCPMKPGTGGGILLREKDGKYDAVAGTKGYRWLESDVVNTNGKEGDIDTSYYVKLVDSAVDTISEFGDIEWFVA